MNDERNLGGGSGGGTGMDDDGNKLESASSTYQIAGNQVVLLSRAPVPPPKPAKQSGPSRIVILAAGKAETLFNDGTVDMRGSKGVRITSGPPSAPEVSPKVSSDSTDGVEIMVSAKQDITLYRGDPDLPASQWIALYPEGISIVGGVGKILISSDTEITLAVGENSITIGPQGIKIIGLPQVQINPMAPPTPVVPGPAPGEDF